MPNAFFANIFTVTKPSNNLIQGAHLNPAPPGSPQGMIPGSSASGGTPPMWATCITTTELNENQIYTHIPNPSMGHEGGKIMQGRNLVPRPKPPSTPRYIKRTVPKQKIKQKGISSINAPAQGPLSTSSNGSKIRTNPKQQSMMDFIVKGKKRINTLQLTPEVTKKLNNREVTTTWESTVSMVTELLQEIIYSEFPLVISPIFAHLNTQKQGTP